MNTKKRLIAYLKRKQAEHFEDNTGNFIKQLEDTLPKKGNIVLPDESLQKAKSLLEKMEVMGAVDEETANELTKISKANH